MASRQQNHEGTVNRQPNGHWRARLMVNGVRRTQVTGTEREAYGLLRRWQREAATDGGLASSVGRTLSDLARDWLATADLRETTRRHYADQLRLHVLPDLSSVKLERLTPNRIQRLYATLTPATAAHVHRILHRAFDVAVRWRWMGYNPCDLVERPHHRAKRVEPWTAEQLRQFLAGSADHPLGPLFIVLATSGLRLGEALALRWQDVGIGGAAINVNGTLRRAYGLTVRNEPKTQAGFRTVLLPSAAIEALSRQRQNAGNDATEDGYIFATTPRAVQKAMAALCDRLALPHLSPHGLRHLHASLLLADGVPLPEVSQRLGHANSGITLSIYSHAVRGQGAAVAAIQRAVEAMP